MGSKTKKSSKNAVSQTKAAKGAANPDTRLDTTEMEEILAEDEGRRLLPFPTQSATEGEFHRGRIDLIGFEVSS